MRKDFIVARPVVTYTLRGNEATKYLEDFQKESTTRDEIKRFKLVVQEPEAHNINRVVTVDLRPFGENEIRVQGIDETWVTGKAEATARLLRAYENKTVSNFRKLGVTLNQLILLAMLVAVPSIQSLWQRAGFVIGVVVLFWCLHQLNDLFLPNVTIYLGRAEAKPIERLLPSVISWIFGILGTIIAAWLYQWLTTSTSTKLP